MTPTASAVRGAPPGEQPGDTQQGRGPFDTGTEGAFYFEEAIREKRLNLLLHLAPYSEALLVTGEQGSGKSCLVERFVARAGEGWRICRLTATPDTGPDEVLGALEEAFGLNLSAPGDDRDTFVRRLREGLHSLRHSALVPLLVVDEAHHLPVSVLHLLASLTAPLEGDEKVLGLLLIGEPAINDTLAQPELEPFRARISHSFDLPPMSEEETARYIHHRLSAAGMDADQAVSPSVVKFIHVASRGLPGRVNELAREVLRNSGRRGEGSGAASSRGRSGLWRYGLAAAVLAALALGLVYQDRWLAPSGEAPSEGGPDQRPGPAFEAPGPQQAAPSPSPQSPPRPPGPGREASGPPPVATAAPEAATPQDAGEGDGSVPTQGGEPGPESGSKQRPARSEPAGASGAGDFAPAGEETAPAARATGAMAGADDPVGGPPETAPEADTAAPASSAPDAEGDGGAPAGLRGAAWLREQDAGRYTVQLLAMSRPKALAYIERHGLGDEVAVYPTRSGGRELLAVTYGLFEERAAATRAGERLVERLGGGVSPWVRSVGGIQTALGSPPPPAAAGGATAPRGEAWLLERPAERYTLQLAAITGEQARAFVERHDIADRAALYRTRSRGSELTAVTYGDYADRASAERAARELGARLGVSPWPRRFGAIQAAIGARRAAP